MSGILGGAAEDQINIDGTKMKVTGLLIGGQPANVDWNMINPDDAFTKIIYDNDITFKETALSATTTTADNYTIVLDNFKTGDQANVYFALQLTNGDKDFYGKYGMIPKDHTFYLVGTMTLPASSDGWIAKHKTAHPDYRITEEATQRVFVQDYMTTATVTISADALKNAVSSIPDLRSTETVFGLSVDLKWETGLSFDVTIQ
jgi:hypothetical protein